ncbi:hypothetical protein PSI23_21240 [Xenorhabdus sp. XENO-10]|uniref:Uncharacterized protein n=1 Tax=Xenorhabdus yunnanensis TaxID=3025878 RepID=A0ABT5LPQ4_9GAMM|nr:hypothetical protein [Xenorhabdus yunnanensis]MDC9591735.1 hypothetical protein [Xenorhabdus yunnanensis]
MTIPKCDIPFRVWWKSPHLLAEQSPNSGLGDNSLISNQTPDLAFGHSITDPIILGYLSRCPEQELHLFKRGSLSTENIGMQSSMSDNRTLGVTGSYSQMTLCINDIYSQFERQSG